MLSFEEDFQDVCMLPTLTQKSQSGAEFLSHFLSIVSIYLLCLQ